MKRAILLLTMALLVSESETLAQDWESWATPSSGSRVWVMDPLPTEEAAPVIVFLHGSGSSPQAWHELLGPLARSLGVVLLLPEAISTIGFGVGSDELTIAEGLELLRDSRAVDEARISISGHSAGGAYAIVLAYASIQRFSSVFTLSSPYRQLLGVADPDYTAPLRLYYGTEDPNYQTSRPAYDLLMQRLSIPTEEQISIGFGHSSWPDSTLEEGFLFLLEKEYGEPGPCLPGGEALCLVDRRFRVTATWEDFEGATGTGKAVPSHSADSGLLYFFDPDNWEVMVKVLDGCTINDHFWVLAAASTNVHYTLLIEDLASAASWSFTNALGQLSPATADVEAFPSCPPTPQEP